MKLENVINANELNDYLEKESIKLINRLKTSNLNDYIKQWINDAVISISEAFSEFKLSLDNKELKVEFSLNLFKTLTNKSLDIYLKLNIIHFLIVSKFDKNFMGVFDLFKIDYETFKNEIFEFFDFNEKLKLIYSEGIFNYKNDLQEAHFSDFYKNLILLAYGKETDIYELMSSEFLILKKIFDNSYHNFIVHMALYLKKLKSYYLRER